VKLTKAEAALLSSTIKQFQAAQADRWNTVRGHLCSNCQTWTKDQACLFGLCPRCSSELGDLLAKIEKVPTRASGHARTKPGAAAEPTTQQGDAGCR
jgi:hypothetical protein